MKKFGKNLDIKYIILEGKEDEFGRFNGVILASKPENITSHDIVDYFRKLYSTKEVGHAGALDPFASGLILILIGKYTKRSEFFLNLDKQYLCDFVFGVSTDSFDIDGKIKDVKGKKFFVEKETLENKLNILFKDYYQTVPVFSSTKVNGVRLRKLARSAISVDEYTNENKEVVAKFLLKNNKIKEIVLPKKKVNIYQWEVLEFFEVNKNDLIRKLNYSITNSDLPESFLGFRILITVSKGTYIRAIARDLAYLIDFPVVLYSLKRTKIGKYDINSII